MANYHIETIERITEQTIEQEIRDDISNALDYIEEKKDELVSNAYNGKSFIDSANDFKNDVDNIAEDTIFKIENNIRQMIVDNGYIIKIIDDEKGNIDMILDKEVV